MRNLRPVAPRPPTFSLLAAPAAVVLVALTVAACGEESAGTGASAATRGNGDRAKLERAALKHARCVRELGIDVPDPKPGRGAIILTGPGSGGDPGAQERAVKKCGHHLRDVPPPKLSDEQKTAMRDGALKHARCMRGQGIEFPDPRFDDRGGITVKIGDGFDPGDPRVRAAERKCQGLLPRPG